MTALSSLTELVGGVLLLANRFVPLALALIAPVIVNIFLFHAFLEPSGMIMAIIVAVLEVYLAWAYRDAFRPMLAARVTPSGQAR
jgi:peptidoglycan biosynthesis protein MviN/MurJ (putative lipid II flippase)